MMLSQLRPAAALVLAFLVLTGLAFPLGFVGLGSLLLPFQSGGSLIRVDGRVVGSALIGQAFTSDRYFHPRPSALMGTDPKDPSKQVPTPYDASESGASNLAPTSKALLARVSADLAAAGPAPVPADAVTTSGSGLDPDISPANAERQVARVAQARGLPAEQVRAVLARHVAGRLLGLIGEPHVNVLALNLDLDRSFPGHGGTGRAPAPR
jgi:K+-transporting ATPase ATPase C chain